MGHGCLTRSGMGSWTLNALHPRPDTLAPSLAPQNTVPSKHIEFFWLRFFPLLFKHSLEPNLYPHGQTGGTCYQLMKAIDPGATKINFIIVFYA
jgi:hypothetical protein